LPTHHYPKKIPTGGLGLILGQGTVPFGYFSPNEFLEISTCPTSFQDQIALYGTNDYIDQLSTKLSKEPTFLV
jgi:hypothetical protein